MKNQKKISKAFIAVLAACFFNTGAHCGEIDALLDKLVGKNLLEGYEAQEIRIGTQEEVKKEISRGMHKTLPLWLQAITLSGDVRLRYQKSDNDNIAEPRQRGRYRLRLFLNSKVNEQVFTGFGFASGENADPRSTNQTFKDNFGKKNLYIDFVYAEYFPYEWLSFMAGRNKNPIWMAGDMLWDSDINPEGALLRTEIPVSSHLKLTTLGGFFLLNEVSTAPKDPYAVYGQQAIVLRDDDNAKILKWGLSYYDFKQLKAKTALAHRPSTTEGYQNANATSGSKYKYSYRPAVADIDFSLNLINPVNLPLVNRSVSHLGFFSTYVRNTAIASGNEGWLAGFRLGQEKAEDTGQFQFSYSLRRLESEAWLDSYPDSDFYGGSTNVKGSEYILTVGILRHFALVFDYYMTEPVTGNLKKEKLFQTEVNLKF